MPRPPHDGGEDSSRGVITGKASFAEPGAVVTDQSSGLLLAHGGAGRGWCSGGPGGKAGVGVEGKSIKCSSEERERQGYAVLLRWAFDDLRV